MRLTWFGPQNGNTGCQDTITIPTVPVDGASITAALGWIDGAHSRGTAEGWPELPEGYTSLERKQNCWRVLVRTGDTHTPEAWRTDHLRTTCEIEAQFRSV